ncbi:MAG: response regulator transcription factor [Actinomycetia bacterium]|nr:response regulator transcription factor [Actinomycetes bacterium]
MLDVISPADPYSDSVTAPASATSPPATGQATVLVVDDDHTVAVVVVSYLEKAGLRAVHVGDGSSALAAFAAEAPDLVVLDLMLPDLDGLEVCRRLRVSSDTPIIMLTALGDEVDRVLGLEVGADDYVTKPFSPRELVLRVQSVLRRAARDSGDSAAVPRDAVLRDGDLVLDTTAHTATRGGQSLPLTSREFDLLAFLLANSGRAFTRGELMEQVWGWSFGDQSTVTVHVRRLREKVEPEPTTPSRLMTVWGVGYRWDLVEQAP